MRILPVVRHETEASNGTAVLAVHVRPQQATRVSVARRDTLRVRALLRGIISHTNASFSFYWYRHPRGPLLYLYRDRLRQFIRSWIDYRRAVHEEPLAVQISPKIPYVIFPLQFEPEAPLQSEAADAPSQLTIIDWPARAAPSGWQVVIKEHPIQTPRRPAGFWRTVRRYPNGRIAAKFESGEALMEQAAVVAVIDGTLGL